MTSALEKKLENIKITQSLLDSLDYDKGFKKTNTVTMTESSATTMFVFRQSDLDAASYYLARSLEDPLNPYAIKCVFVQESCVEKFSEKLKAKLKPYSKDPLENVSEKLKAKLKPYSKDALENKTLLNALTTSSQTIAKLNAKTICVDAEEIHAPKIVYGFSQEHFTAGGPSPVVSLFIFRTVKEAIDLSKKESVSKNATIWCENHATGYELIDATSLENYYLNCYNIPWTPIQEYVSKQPFVVIEGSYHYETLIKSGIWKNIVFPFGTSFAN